MVIGKPTSLRIPWGFVLVERASLLYAQCCEAVFVFVMAKRQFSYFIINASASRLLRQAGQVYNDLS